MSDVADKDLCAELFRLSGWVETEKSWFMGTPYSSSETEYRVGSTTTSDSNGYMRIHPAYSLGYLLRKLPAGAMIEKNWIEVSNTYSAFLAGTGAKTADTPENAAAQLCIQLIKSGIIPIKGEK